MFVVLNKWNDQTRKLLHHKTKRVTIKYFLNLINKTIKLGTQHTVRVRI